MIIITAKNVEEQFDIIADKTGYIDDTCDYCKSKVFPVPEKYWTDADLSFISNEQKTTSREELVKNLSRF